MRPNTLNISLLAGLAMACAPAVAGQQILRPGVIAAGEPYARVQLAQSNDSSYRVNELEQQVRQLTGKVEDLTFQLLQLQEQIRKMQEDNEQRFLDIEENKSGAVDAEKTEDTANATPTPDSGDTSLEKPETSEAPAAADVNQADATAPNAGEPPKDIGTLTFDNDGNVVDNGAINSDENVAALPKMKLPGVFSDGVDGGVEAAEYGPTPDAVLEVGRRALQNKRYKRAEGAFRAHLKAWPKDPKKPEVQYHLGESLFWQKNYVTAANMFLDTHNEHPRAKTAADNLLHLGLSLAGLNQREVACVTYAEVLKQYPEARERLQSRVEAEQFSAKC